MRSFVKYISALLITAVLCVSLVGCFPFCSEDIDPEQIDSEVLELVGEPTMRYEYDEEFSEYVVYVEGFVKNISKYSKSYIYVTYVIYDADGNTLTTASAYCEYLEADGIWRFCATGYSPYEPASVKLLSLY